MTTRPSPRILTCLSLALLAWGIVITVGWAIAVAVSGFQTAVEWVFAVGLWVVS